MRDHDFAMLIGINHYVDPIEGPGKLTGAFRDVAQLRNWLTDPSGGQMLKSHCHSVLSTTRPRFSPGTERIDDEIKVLVDQIHEYQRTTGHKAERLYFYFSGHGSAVENSDNTALCTAQWTSLMRGRALSTYDYRNLFKMCGLFSEVVFIVDCCRNIQDMAIPVSPSLYLTTRNRRAGNVRLFTAFATRHAQDAFEYGRASNRKSLFTEVLIQGLKGGARNERGKVDAESLKKYLVFVVPQKSDAEDVYQEPEIYTDATEAHNIVFSELIT